MLCGQLRQRQILGGIEVPVAIIVITGVADAVAVGVELVDVAPPRTVVFGAVRVGARPSLNTRRVSLDARASGPSVGERGSSST